MTTKTTDTMFLKMTWCLMRSMKRTQPKQQKKKKTMWENIFSKNKKKVLEVENETLEAKMWNHVVDENDVKNKINETKGVLSKKETQEENHIMKMASSEVLARSLLSDEKTNDKEWSECKVKLSKLEASVNQLLIKTSKNK